MRLEMRDIRKFTQDSPVAKRFNELLGLSSIFTQYEEPKESDPSELPELECVQRWRKILGSTLSSLEF